MMGAFSCKQEIQDHYKPADGPPQGGSSNVNTSAVLDIPESQRNNCPPEANRVHILL